MSTAAEKFAQIIALCDEADEREGTFHKWVLADRIRTRLAEPDPAAEGAFTRDRVRTELAASLPADPKWVAWVDGVLDRLEASS